MPYGTHRIIKQKCTVYRDTIILKQLWCIFKDVGDAYNSEIWTCLDPRQYLYEHLKRGEMKLLRYCLGSICRLKYYLYYDIIYRNVIAMMEWSQGFCIYFYIHLSCDIRGTYSTANLAIEITVYPHQFIHERLT